jgi:hypothetical protein
LSMFDDSLHFVLCFSFNDVRRGHCEVWAMCGGFGVRGEERGVEYVVDLPS